MPRVKFLTDEDIYSAVAVSLRRSGWDAVSTPEAGRRGELDEAQFDFATRKGRTLVTFNVAHFAKLHWDWLQQGRTHSGIIVSSQRPIGELLRALIRLASTVEADVMEGRLEYLSDWVL